MIAQLEFDDAVRYLDDRAARGFNAVVVNLIEHKFSVNAPADRAGVRPFGPRGAFRDPNPTYFAKAHRVVEQARRRGIAVWLCPAYLGWGGGDEGFFAEISALGPSALRGYGRFVGERFKDLPNIVWLIGGDYAFPASQRWLGDELAAGLREGGAQQLISAHGGRTSAVETFGDRRWLAIDTVYSYASDLRPALQAAFNRTPARPFVLIEALYEGEHDVKREQLRRQAWTATLSGAAGQFFGNNPVWHFGGAGQSGGTWREALGSDGARDAARLAALITANDYPALEPDREGVVRTTGNGDSAVVAALTSARNRLIAYLPAGSLSTREVLLNLRTFRRAMNARWLDPAGDVPPREAGILKPNADGQRLEAPLDERGAAADWVLLLDSR